MIDIVNQINTTQREMGNQAVAAGEGRSIPLRRVYDAPTEDVWSACTDPERLGRWPGPVEGDLSVGGTSQFRDNAGGAISRREELRPIKVTRVFDEGMPDEAEVRLAPGDDIAAASAFVARHHAPEASGDR